MSWTQEEVQEAVTKVIERANTDAEYRTLVLSDVHAAVKEVTGKEVPEEFKINVVDSTGYHANIVLPEMQGAEDELSEADMEMVAGGSKDIVGGILDDVIDFAESTAKTTINETANTARKGKDIIF